MKTFKRTLSCFLALLMIFGSFSVLSYAALDDGNENTFQVYSKFFVDGEEVTEVKAGDTVKVRVYLKNDYLMSTTCILFVYPTTFMEFVVEDDFVLESSTDTGDSYNVAAVLNTSATSTAVLGNLSGYFNHQEGFVLDSMSPADNLVYDGFVSEDYWDDKGWVALTIDGGKPVKATAANDDDYLVEYTFTVKDSATADSKGYFNVIVDSELTPENNYGFTCCERSQTGAMFNTLGSDLATVRDYTLDTSLDTNTIKLAAEGAVKYAVTYSFTGDVPEGYDTQVPAATEAEEGDSLSLPVITVPSGYRLTWSAKGATKNTDGTYTVGTEAVAFTGTWAKLYPVTYVYAGETPDGYTAPAAIELAEGEAITEPTGITIPEGYTLTWATEGAVDGKMGTEAVTMKGTWAKIDYNVTYSYANEAPEGAAAAPTAGTTTVGATIAAPSTDAPAGYTLTWAVTGATKNDDGSYTAGANDVSFVGTWATIEYDVTYSYANEAPEGAAAAPAAGKTTVGATINPGITAPAGYTLTWAVTGATDNGDGTYTAGANNVTFVGTWATVEYDVTYSFSNEGPDGIDVPAATKTTVGATIDPGITPPAGWTFRWDVTGATSNGDGTFTAGANDVEFVGTWTKKEYAVTYSFANEGPEGVDAPAAETSTVGATIAAPSTVAPEGWTLTWAVTGATKNDDGSYTAGANDVEFVGTWEKKSYTITYYLSEQDQADGKVYDTQTVVYGDAITPIADPKVDGKIFDAWDLDFPATMPADNLEAVAIFSDIVVTFYDVWGDSVKTLSVVTEITDADLPSEDDATAGEDVNFVEWQLDGAKLETPYALEGSVDVYAYCTVDIVFYANEEMTAEHYTLTVDFGHIYTEDDIAGVGEPTKLGHDFDGWDVDFVDSEALQNNYAVPSFVPNDYTATFMVNGEVYDTKTATFGTEIEAPAKAPEKEGYTFKGWAESENGTALDELVMDAEGKTFYPVFVMNGSADFLVELYLMNTEGKYDAAPAMTLYESGLIGVTANVDHDGCQQYVDDWFSADTSEDADNVYSNVIAEDGSTVLKLYYKRATYKVSVDGAEATDVYHGATVTAPSTSANTPAGYELASWNNGAYTIGQEIEVTGALTLTPDFVAGTSTYTIKTYTMGLDGEYGDAVEATDTYTTDETVTYTAPAVEGFKADKDSYSVKVTGDNLAVIEVYYARNQYDVTIDGAASKVYHGATVTAPSTSANTPAGYELASWNNGAYTIGQEIEVTGALTLTPDFVAGTSTYTIKTYTMGLDGEYGDAVEATDTYTTDETVTYTAPAVEGFKADKDSYSVKVTGDNLAVIEVYYARNQYDVTIDGVASKVYHGATVTAPSTSANTPAGYSLASWNDGAVALGQEIEVTGNLTLTPDYTADTNTKYTVEIYLMDTEGNYAETADDTDVLAGTTDTLATAAHADYAQEAWFTPAATGNVTEATITGDGNATLKLYFERAQYDVTIDGVASKVYHGATIKAPESTTQAAPAGYAFAGWNNGTIAAGDEITVTEAMELVPYFAEGAATYTVEIYLQDAEGNYGAASKTETETGKTGDTVTIAHADYAQEAYYLADDAAANAVTGTIAGDGSLTLKLYFKRAEYTVAYEYEDGTAIASETLRYGAAIEAPAYETPDGMNLLGWFDKETSEKMPATMPAKNATYVVKFVAGDSTPYIIQVNIMDVDGVNYITTETQALGTTGATQTIVPDYSREGFTVNTEKSNLTDAIAGDGSTVLSVYYDRNLYTATFDGVDYQVYYGASLPEVEPAAQEGKEFDAWTPEVPATMPAEDLEFTSTWTDVMYKIIYIINGTEEEYEYAAGATVTPIADPVVPGMTFIKWNKTIPTTMPAEDVIIVAEFEAAVFKVTFLDGDGKVWDEKAVQYGDTIVLPTSNPTKEYHVFNGWIDVPETMPAANVTIYPDFERVPVRLVAAEGSTTVIDRSTMIITGLTTKFNDAKAANYLAVEGDGYYKLTSVEGYEGFYGTGAKVEVYDNADTSAPVEVFYIVIYGDINGDSAVNSADNTIVEDEVLFATSWSRGDTKDELMVMAADLNKDGKVKQGDADSIMNSALGIAKIDQATGNVIR